MLLAKWKGLQKDSISKRVQDHYRWVCFSCFSGLWVFSKVKSKELKLFWRWINTLTGTPLWPVKLNVNTIFVMSFKFTCKDRHAWWLSIYLCYLWYCLPDEFVSSAVSFMTTFKAEHHVKVKTFMKLRHLRWRLFMHVLLWYYNTFTRWICINSIFLDKLQIGTSSIRSDWVFTCGVCGTVYQVTLYQSTKSFEISFISEHHNDWVIICYFCGTTKLFTRMNLHHRKNLSW